MSEKFNPLTGQLEEVPDAPEPIEGADQVPDPVAHDPEKTDGTSASRGVVLQRLAEKQRKLASEREPLLLEIPGYEGELLCRYQYVAPNELTKNSKDVQKVKNQTSQMLLVSIDTLIITCKEFIIRVDDKLVPLSQDEFATTYGPDLIEDLTGAPSAKVTTARQAVRWLFRGNDYAIMKHAEEINEWLQGNQEDFEEDFLGESVASTK